MKIRILRRRGLGNTSTKAIKQFSDHDIEIIRSDKEIPQDTDLLIRWGTTTKLPAKKTLNKASAINLIANKYLCRKKFFEAGISVPKLFTQDNVVFPVIVRPHYHSQGKKLWFCNNQQELKQAISKAPKNYISEYIQKDREYGVFVFNGRVTSMIEKVPKNVDAKNSVAWNVSQGTHAFQNLKWSEWNIQAAKLALEATNLIDGHTFSRVDIIEKDGVCYVLELNSAHSLTSEYRQKVFAKCLDYYIDNGPVQNELDLSKNLSFKSLIHPALRVNKQGHNV